MKRSPEWWFLMAIATGVFAIVGWLLLKDLLEEEFGLFIVFYTLFILLGDGATALAAEKLAPSFIHVGPGERLSRHDPTSDRAIAVADFDTAGSGRVIVRSEVWRARLADGAAKQSVSERDVLRIVGRDGLTLLVDRNDTGAGFDNG